MINVCVECNTCSSVQSVDVDMNDYATWLEGNDLVQDIFPNLTPSEREIIIGTKGFYLCDGCWI